ncbi:unnamed protein product [Rotaria sp. Silwood2]|nr:unnamed protein product [Rotaria sp. Silwood2]
MVFAHLVAYLLDKFLGDYIENLDSKQLKIDLWHENSKTVSKHKDTFLERLQLHILRNLTLSISNIHIAYEDKTTKPDHPFSFGITLNYIKLYTTNYEWVPVVSKDESPIIYKLGELNALSIYWKSDVKSQSELSQENIIDKLQANIVKKENTAPDHMTYILRPLNISVKIKIAATPHEQDYARPVFDAKIDLDYISLNINRNQYCDLLDLLEFQDHLNLELKYIKYYTMIDNNSTDKLSVRRWKFAYVAILNEEVRPRLASYKWENIKTNLDRFREYHDIYFQVLTGNASKQQKQRAEELERKIDVFNLLVIRRTVEIEIKKKKAEQKEQGWWDKLTSWWTGESNKETSELDIDSATVDDEKKKLYDAIGYAEDDTSLAYPEEYVDIDLTIRLSMLEINVWSNINENDSQLKVIASAAVPDVCLIFKRCPAKSGFLFVIDLGSFKVFGVTTDTIEIEKSNDNRPVLAKPANEIQLKEKDLLHIEYETNPLDKSSENRIQVILQSLEITYDAFTINKLVECFQPDKKRDLQGWKIDVQISAIDGRLYDTHIFEIIKLFQSIPLPESKEEEVETEILVESTTFEVTVPRRNTKKTLEAVESMTPVQKILQEAASAEAEDKTNEQTPAEIVKKKVDLQEQIIELEATFELPRIHLLIEESLSDSSNDSQPFVRITLLSMIARATMKTFDIDFNASLADFSIVHEQFVTNNNDRLCLIAMERLRDRENGTLISISGLLTSPVNPNFASAPYYAIENQIRVHIGKPVLMLQLEALLSIIRFKNDIMEKISNEQHLLSDKKVTKRRTASKGNPKHVVKKDPASGMPTFQIEAHLEGLRAIIGLEFFQIIDIQSQGLRAHILNSVEKTSAHLILTDLRAFDPNPKARYRHIISQRSTDKQLLRVDFTLFNYPKNYEKTLDDIDCEIKIQLTKKTERDVSSNEPTAVSETMDKFQNQARKLRLDVTLDAPSILVPTSSYSNEGLFIDLGLLTAETHFTDNPKRSSVEQQVVIMKNLLASRVQLGKNNETRGDISLFKCAELSTLIDRLLYPDKIQNEPQISIVANWDIIQFTLAKDDYACIMKIFKENFSEKIYHKIPKPAVQEKTEYRQTSQNNVTVTNKNQENLNTNQISEKIHFNAEIKTIAITLYLSESKLITRHASRNENLKFLDLRLETLKAHFRQLSDSSYDGKAQIQTLLLDDLRETNKSNSITRMIDRNFNVDPNASMFTVTLEFKKENEQQSSGVRQVNAQLESFYICMSSDYFMALYDFFISSLSLSDEKKPHPSIMYSETSSDIDYDMPLPAKPISTFRRSNRSFSGALESTLRSPKRPSETLSTTQDASPEAGDYLHSNINIVIKSPEIILLEDQHNNNSNCLVLSILQPVDIDAILIMNLEQQNIDVRIGDITIQISPAAVRTVLSLIKSMGKLETPIRNETEKINSKGIFDTKPFKDASFWFIKDYEEKQELIEQTDVLELTTGTPSHKKAAIEEANNEKKEEEKIQTQNILSQELILNLKIIEIKLELGTGSSTKPVIAMCLSNMFVDVKNWSSDISISSKIHVELALFNDNLLAWEPLIEPVINERGEVVCPWCITCSTSSHEEDEENDDESRFLLDDPKSSSNIEQKPKDDSVSLDAKQVIYVRADHLLNVTITKTMLSLVQRLSTMIKDAYNKQSPWNEDDNDRSMLSIHNMTGYDIYIDNLSGIKFLEDKKLDTPIHLKNHDSIPLTVPDERLSATRIPAISEQISNRRQEFSVIITNQVKTLDINQTWRRIFDLGPSPIPDWPIQLLCDSQIYNDRRRIVLSSIIKIFNRATMPVMILDIDSVELGTYREVARVEANGELYLPLELVYVRMNSRLFISIEEAKSTNGVQDFISFDWAIESSADRVLKMKNGKDANLVFYKESKEAYSENTDEPIRTSFHVYVKLALHLINLLSLDIECWIDGHIRLFSKEQDDAMSEWSEGFSLDVIKSTGMASCKVANDRTYMIEIEVTEAQSDTEEEQWRSVKPEEIIPFWPRNMEGAVMCVRYTHNRISSTAFSFTQKHRTLLYMNDEERPALQVEVIATDFDGFRVVFGDYKIGDAPVLLVNCLKYLPIGFCQATDIRTQVLPPLHYVYYTWVNPLKPRTLVVACHDQSVSIELNLLCGVLEAKDLQPVYYAVFQDGPQTVLLFSEETDLIKAVTNMPSLGESMKQHIQVGIRDIGIAIIDDIARNDLFYISISKSKDIWMESSKSHMKPLSYDLNKHVDEQYESYIKDHNAHPNDEKFASKKYRIDENRDVSFDEDTAELTDHQDHLVRIKRQPLDGLWVGFAWSTSNSALHLRINRVQIDNEHEFTLFPVVLNSIVSKAAGTDIPGKPFIELSLFKTTIARSNTTHIK